MRKLRTASVALALIAGSAMADATYSGSGTWHTSGNWTGATGATGLPTTVDNLTIGGTMDVMMNADTWQHLVDNSLLTGGASGEYRNRQIRLGSSGGTQVMTLDQGSGNTYRVTEGSTHYIGSANGSDSTLNVNSGTSWIESSKFYVGEKAGSTGAVNLNGGQLYIARENGGKSVWIGDGGTGSLTIDSGLFRTRGGLTLGATGSFNVLGSGADTIGIGNYNSVDGNWDQKSGGLLNIGVDAGGVDQITIDEQGGDGGTYAIFESGSLLDISFLDGAQEGTWTIMEVELGDITDNGLAFAGGVDTGIWSFNVDNSGANGVLTVTAIPEPATLGLIAMVGTGLIMVRRFRI